MSTERSRRLWPSCKETLFRSYHRYFHSSFSSSETSAIDVLAGIVTTI